jgi:hypothetical protein
MKRYRPVNLHGADPERLMVEDPYGDYCLVSEVDESVGPFKTPQQMFEDDMRRITSHHPRCKVVQYRANESYCDCDRRFAAQNEGGK